MKGARVGCLVLSKAADLKQECAAIVMIVYREFLPYLQICALERCIESRRVRLKLFGQTAHSAQHSLETAGPFSIMLLATHTVHARFHA